MSGELEDRNSVYLTKYNRTLTLGPCLDVYVIRTLPSFITYADSTVCFNGLLYGGFSS